MLITVVNVSAPETIPSGKGKSYQKVQVAYRDQNEKLTGKNLISFNNPKVFEFFTRNTLDGKVVEVDSVKNSKGFYEWTSAKISDGTAAPKQEARPTVNNSRGFETPENRAVKQRIITRIATVNTAIEYVNSQKIKASLEEVLTHAQALESYVYEGVDVDTLEFVKAAAVAE